MFALFLSATIFCKAGSNLPDSLYKLLLKEKTDTTRARIMNNLGWAIYQNSPDSGLSLINRAIEISEKEGYPNLTADCYRNKGIILKNLIKLDEAQKNIEKSIDISQRAKYEFGELKGKYQLGIIYKNKAEFNKAIPLLLEVIKRTETTNKSLCSDAYLSLANVYGGLKNHKKAIEFYNDAIKIKKEIGAKPTDLATILNNVGLTYYYMKDFKKAKEYILQANELYQQTEELGGLAYSKATMALIYIQEGKHAEAEKEFLEMAEIYKKINDPHGLAETYTNLGSTYIMMAVAKNKDRALFDKAIRVLKLALKLGMENKSPDNIEGTYLAFTEAYQSFEKYKEAFEYKTLYENFKDSVVDQEVHHKAMEMEKTFQTEKKQAQIDLQKAELEKATAENGREKSQKIAFGIGLLFSVVLLIISVLGYRKIKHTSQIVSAQKAEMEKQKIVVEAKNTEILDSIYYAKRIQQTLLANVEEMERNLPEHFVFFSPKDIVSGDFYWAHEKGDKFYLAVCDSTGHGVPGAFMSLLNISFLSEAIGEMNISAPNEVFNYVRERLIASVSTDGKHDGMDGVLLCMDKKTGKITYSAAQNSPMIVYNGEIIDCPTNKMPIGKGENTNSFELFELPVKKGGVLYVYTDGYPDQFGGTKGKKLKSKQLREFILAISSLPMHEQKLKLEQKLVEWKGDLEQVDDILVMGIRI